MSHSLRTLVGCAALAAGLWAVTAAAAAEGVPDLSKETYKKAAEADLKFLKERLADLAKQEEAGAKLKDGYIKPALGIALLVAAYGDALGDAALKGDAVKVAEALAKKDIKAASAVAGKMAVKPGAAGKAGPLPKPLKDEVMLEAVMSPFRGGNVGGLNIDRDIQAMTKSKDAMKIDPGAVEILATRSAVINAYAFNHPNDKAGVKADSKKAWEKLAADSVELSKQVAVEAAKGAKADEKAIKKALTGLNARCSDCHDKFRD